jgi:hypothetical protein
MRIRKLREENRALEEELVEAAKGLEVNCPCAIAHALATPQATIAGPGSGGAGRRLEYCEPPPGAPDARGEDSTSTAFGSAQDRIEAEGKFI